MFWVQFEPGPAGFKGPDLSLGSLPALPAMPLNRVCDLSLGCWDLLLWGQLQDRFVTCVCVCGDCPAVVCPGKRLHSFACQDQPLHSSQASCTPTNKVWDLGNKTGLFSMPLFLYCLSWGSLLASTAWLLGQAGSWHPSCCQPFSPITGPCRAVKGHAVKLLGPRGQCQSSSVLALRAHGQWLPSRSPRLAGPCLGSAWDTGEGSFQTQCQALACWGKASSPLGTAKSRLLFWLFPTD